MRYSHPSIFSSLSDVPISLKTLKKTQTQFFFFNNKQDPLPQFSQCYYFLFCYRYLLQIQIHARWLRNQKQKRREEDHENRDGEEVTLWVWVWTTQSHNYHGVVQRIIGCGTSLQLQVKLYVSLSLAFLLLFPSLCSSLGKQLKYFDYMRQKSVPGKSKVIPIYFFAPFFSTNLDFGN